MNPTIHGPAVRFALTLGLVAGAWLIPSASSIGVEALSAPSAPLEVTEPDRIYLAQADAGAGGTPVTYSSDQADRGEEKFNDECAECHGHDLRGGLIGGPPLRGVSFEQKFLDGAPASGLFGFMSTAMPPNAPGRFSPAVYADMMAYILKQNGFQAGAELPSDLDALDNLILEK